MFKKGTWKFKDTFTVQVKSENEIYVSPNHPLAVRVEEIFNPENWQKVVKGEVKNG